MYSVSNIMNETDSRIFSRGVTLYENGHVEDLDVSGTEDGDLRTVYANVRSSHGNSYYSVRLVFSVDGEHCLDAECNCPYFSQYMEDCKHIAAVKLAYVSWLNENAEKEHAHSKRVTDYSIQQIIENFEDTDTDIVPVDSVHMYFTLSASMNEDGTLDAEFQIGHPAKRSYVIQNIDSFCSMIRAHEDHRWGKELSFVHTLDAFDDESRSIVSFLLSLENQNDTYSSQNYSNYGYYMDTSYIMKRVLHLKGRYLDEFINIIKERNLEFSDPSYEHPERIGTYILKNEHPSFKSMLEKTDDGYLLSGSYMETFRGNSYLYSLDTEGKQMYRYPLSKDTMTAVRLLKSSAEEDGLFIASNDLSSFGKYVYPMLSTQTLIDNKDGFDPLDYAPLKPKFEIYLDMPHEDFITGRLNAVYGDNKYQLPSSSQSTRRDEKEEERMLNYVGDMFGKEYQFSHRLILEGSSDTTYQFITEKIPSLQRQMDVFVSDNLNSLKVRPVPSVKAGVSVSHDLLQLDLITDTISTKQLAEILNRYEKKKKYYRLKDGSFLTLDNSLDEVENLKNKLGLSTADITSGSVQLPKYRAFYMDTLQKDGGVSVTGDESFHQAVLAMKDTDNADYVIPADLHAEMRSYQIEGFRWLCSLYHSGLAALLADEMGLGKTLEVIAFIGSLQNRKRCLVVCPASLVYNWSSEIQKFMPSLPAVMIQGTAGIRKYQIENSKDDEIMITSYDLLKRDIDLYKDLNFDVEVIDEAQFIKNSSTQVARAVKKINSSFRIALTGTPIENRLSELWSIFDYLLPGFFFSYPHFRTAFEQPIVRDQDQDIEADLRRMITPFVLRRLKKNVLKDLPEKLETVYYSKLEGEQKELYDARVQKLKQSLEKQTDKEFSDSRILVLSEITRLRQICADPRLVYEHYHGNSSKLDLCQELVSNAINEGHKILLFSQFTTMLDEITESLDRNDIPYHLLKGSTPKLKRAEMVESFQTDNVPVFCISLKAGGTGLNLTAADIVIHYDPWWNTAVENQASDRAHRIGQTNVVSVCRLIMRDTIEERILNLQQEKSKLAGAILSGEGMSSASLSREDLLELL